MSFLQSDHSFKSHYQVLDNIFRWSKFSSFSYPTWILNYEVFDEIIPCPHEVNIMTKTFYPCTNLF